MIAMLGLEERQSGYLGPLRSKRDLDLRVTKAVKGHLGGAKAVYSPWVAKITGHDPRFGLSREFVRGTKDYRDASSSGNRGVRLYFVLHPGYYEVREILSLSKERRYFVRSECGKISEVEREEVEQWASEQNQSNASSRS